MKRFLCLLLAVLMILPMAAACGNGETPPAGESNVPESDTPSVPSDSDDPAASGDGTDSTPVETDPPVRAHGVPVDELDFGNAEFNIIAYEWQGYPYYFFAEEESSDPMDAALYNRQREIEEELGVKMTYFMYKKETELNNAIEMDVQVGTTTTSMALLHCIIGLSRLTSNGFLYPLEKLDHVDLSADWWNLEQMDTLRAGKNYYLGVNDYMIPCPYVIFFNKDMVADMADLGDPYQLVLDQKWTFDTFVEMARTATIDINNDGVYDLDNDSFGVACDEVSNYVSFIPASDQPITEKDEDGKLVLAMNTEKMADLVADFAELTKEHIFYPDISTQPNQITMDSDRLLFLLSPISSAEKLRDCEVPYGILPYPKYDEAQENYKTLDWGGLMCVPSVITDPEMVGAVIELLAFKAQEEVIPAYYDLVLDGQLSQDPQSSKMLDVIFDTICYEPGMNYWGLSSPFMQLLFVLSHHAIWKENGNFASIYAEHAEGTQRQIDTYYETLKLYEDYNAALD